ncbi:hypothetical protein MARA_04230 [Mycolicibacterium arabiense]|uniref:Uncharacterized protein n=1 Tax=Mycolicibacterium arabiense TaxID=1286181 RepID=A0A7I7RT71_9MYCO|nr:hypothetical protein MARA_04230 [Mycolicibacterium arabiense]
MSHPHRNSSAGDSGAPPRWGGAALLRPGVLAFAGSIGSTDTHAHHAVQVTTTATPLTVIDGDGVAHTGTKVVVPADTTHAHCGRCVSHPNNINSRRNTPRSALRCRATQFLA